MTRVRYIGLIVATIGAVAAAGIATASNANRSGTVTLTLWHNYGTNAKATATTQLVAAFEKLHPNIRIKIVAQPADNYFALLKAAAISHSGPDISNQWTGLYDLKYEKYLLNLKPYLTTAEIARINGAQYEAPNFDISKGLLVLPIANAFYIGFYNKAVFKKAGIAAPPRNWSELYAACAKLKAVGVTPMEYGNTGVYVLGAEFYPWFDFSYLMAGLFTPAQWRGLYTGAIPWTSAAIVAQMKRWVALRQKGCTNHDVLTAANTLQALAKGKAAMVVDGDWDTALLQQQMGSNLGTFVPPYSVRKIHSVVQFPGEGPAVMSSSKHKTEAIEFIKFLLTGQAQRIIAANGLAPDIKGFKTPNPVSNAMLNLASKEGYTQYPLLDNVVQPEVVEAGTKLLTAAFGGAVSVTAALRGMEAALSSLPAGRRGSTYSGG